MISPEDDRIRVVEEVMLPSFECSDNCQEFSVIDFIALLCWVKGLRDEATGLVFSFLIKLVKNSPSGNIRGIGFNEELR